MTTNAIDRFLAGLVDPAAQTGDVFTEDVLLDATVPDWRFHERGRETLVKRVAYWYADPGTFEELVRTPFPGGEIVELCIAWTENGVPHAVHQMHRLTLRDGRIASITMFCGGRWNAARLAAMEEADARTA